MTATLLSAAGAFRAQSCTELEKGRNDERTLVAFLNQEGNGGQSADCVTYALRRLGDLNYDGKSITGGIGAPAVVDVLVKYLDYKRPEPGFGTLGVGGNNELYPAVSALVSIGKAANPALLKVIKNGSSTDTARANAFDAFIFIHRGNEKTAVRALKMAAKSEKDTSAAERLQKAAKDAAMRCLEKLQPACQKLSEED
ncbi:MAG TPA: hypothetical protein VIX19_21640 [Terriglobales bacterium]